MADRAQPAPVRSGEAGYHEGAGEARLPPDARAGILSAWSHGPGVVALVAPTRTGKTALLTELANSFRQAGQTVHVAERGDRATLPSGAAILLIDEAGRVPDLILRRLFDRADLFCVLAARPSFLERLRSLGLTPSVVRIGAAPVAEPPVLGRSSRRSVPPAGVFLGVLVAIAAGAALFGRPGPPARPETPPATPSVAADIATAPADPVSRVHPPAAASPPETPTEAAQSPVSPAPPAEALPGAPPPPEAQALPVAPPTARAVAPAPPLAPIQQAAPTPAPTPAPRPMPAVVETLLPKEAVPTVTIGYAAREIGAATVAQDTAEALRAAGVETLGPVALPRAEHPAIRYYFAQDRAAAEALQNRADGALARLPVELAAAGPTIRPGQLDVTLGEVRGQPSTGYDAVVRARRLSAQDREPQ